MNDWYIDRSKNFINDTLRLTLDFFNRHNRKAISSTELVRLMEKEGVLGGAGGNPNAALTRYRDHGLLRKDNVIGDSAIDFVNDLIGPAELVIDMFSKRPALKVNSPNVKPLFILCIVFDIMQQTIADADDIFITFEEVKEYLFPINAYSDITYELVDRIVSEREYDFSSKMPKARVSFAPNEDTNLSIWFNALQITPLFMPAEGARNVLRPNLKQREFFRFMAVNAEEVSATPTANNEELYSYYCNGGTGISEILPNVIKSSCVNIDDHEAQVLYEYLFGYKKLPNFNYWKFIKYDCFGLFFPFITIPKIVLRNILRENKKVGEALYKFVSISHGYLEAYSEDEMEYKPASSIDVQYSDVIEKNAIGIHITNKNSALDKNNGHICIGWGALGDISSITCKEELSAKYSAVYPERSLRSKGQDVGQIWEFFHDMKVGDYVVYADGNFAHFGRVISPYYYDESIEGQDKEYVHNRKVKWLKDVNYKDIPVGLRHAFCAARSVFSLNEYRSVIREILEGKLMDMEKSEDDLLGLCDRPHRNPRVYKSLPMNFILYGAPGTGKTYSSVEYALAIVNKTEVFSGRRTRDERAAIMGEYNNFVSQGRIVFTTFHQSYGYEDFIQGLRPDTTSDKISFKPVDGVFKTIADRAMADFDNNYVIIIDEINRANISKVFGELITLIEDDKRWGELNEISITLPSGESFAVPNNLYIIGTMNSADKSISLIDAALRRRFDFIEIVPDYSAILDSELRTVLERINEGLVEELDSTDLLVGHAYFIGKTIDDLCNIMNRAIIPLLYEYFYDNVKKVKNIISCAINGMPFNIEDSQVGRIKLIRIG